jgi:hypothetical protein
LSFNHLTDLEPEFEADTAHRYDSISPRRLSVMLWTTRFALHATDTMRDPFCRDAHGKQHIRRVLCTLSLKLWRAAAGRRTPIQTLSPPLTVRRGGDQLARSGCRHRPVQTEATEDRPREQASVRSKAKSPYRQTTHPISKRKSSNGVDNAVIGLSGLRLETMPADREGKLGTSAPEDHFNIPKRHEHTSPRLG